MLGIKTKTLAGFSFSTRRIVSSIVAAAVVATSAFPASAESYFFRYKQPASWSPKPTNPADPQLGVGNDVTVFFTGPLNQPFSKVIPVKTKDVAEWKIQSGSMQEGLGVASAAGMVSGIPTGKEVTKKAVLVGYDASGHLIARAAITSRFHDPAGASTDFTFYGHTNKYLYRQIPATVPVAKWESIADMPDDFHTEGRYLAGTPKSEYTTGVGFIGYDYMGKEVVFTYGDLLVQDKPVIAHIPDQIRHPSKPFSTTASVQYKVGEIKYRLVALDGQTGFSLSSKTGKLAGSIKTFNTSRRFRIEALDVDGTMGTSNVFTFSTSSPDVEMASMKDQQGTVNKPFLLQITGKDLSGDMSWKVVKGELPLGLSLDPETGEISGMPTKVEKKTDIVIAVSTSDGGSGQTPAFDFEIFPEEIGVDFQALDTRIGRPFVTAGPVMGTGIVNPYSFELAAGSVESDDVTVDYGTAVVSGRSDTPADLSIDFNLKNGDGREKVFTQPITVHDNLALAYADDNVVYRRIDAAVAPTIATGIIGNGSFTVDSGALPEGLSLDPATGNIIGTPAKVGFSGDISVKISDDSGESTTSNDFQIEVQDRPAVQAAAADVEVERFVDNAVPAATATNAFDGVEFELVAGTLPEGLSLDEDGVIRGSTQDLEGVYGGLQVQATDGEGYKGLSPVFSLKIVPPKDLSPLDPEKGTSDVEVTWAQNVPFSLPLPVPANAFGTITYDLQPLPEGVAVVADRLVGSLPDLGDHVYQYTLIDESRRTLSGTYTVTILEPMSATLEGRGKKQIEVEEGDEVVAEFELPRGGDTVIAPVIKNAIGNPTYVFNGTLPGGLAYANGQIAGKPEKQGETGDFTINVTDEAGTVVTLGGKIVVGERVAISLEYNPANPVGTTGQQITAVMPSVKDAIGTVSYTLSGTLPPGLSFDPTTGFFYGTPTVAGWFQGLTVTAVDTDGGAPYAGTYGPFALSVSLPGNPVMPGVSTFTVRAGEPFERTLSVTGALAPLVFSPTSASGLAHGLTIGSNDGKIRGMFPGVGKYAAGDVKVIDSVNRETTTSVKFVAVGPLAIDAPLITTFNQYASIAASPLSKNVIGAASYELVSGSLPSFLKLDLNTGSVYGNADGMGTWSDLVIRVTDSTGSSAETLPFTIEIGPRLPLELKTAESYTSTVGKNFKLALPVVNAVGAKTFVMTGALPEGISFDAEKGVFSGMAKKLGFFPLTVTVTDSKGASVTKSFTIISETNGKPINLAVTDFVTKVGHQISTTAPTYSNHAGAVRFWADDTLAEHGLTIDPDTGVISGTATQLMDFTPNIHITDESLRVTSKPISIKVVPDLMVNAPDKINLFVNRRLYPYINASADNATSSVVWSIEGTLPKGLYFSKTNRRFSGTPTEMGTFNVKLTVAEKAGFMQTATASVEITVVSDGMAPTVSVKPSDNGYYTNSTMTLYPTYTNAKTGDVLALAPDSAPLPPSVTFVQVSGKYVVRRAAGDSTDAGVYPNVKVRVTSTDGLYGDSEPFTLILKSPFTFSSANMQVRSYDPVSLPPPVPSAGKPVGTATYEITYDGTGGLMKIDPATGAVTGKVTKSGSVTVKVTDSFGGKVLRSVTYSTYFKAAVLAVSTPAKQVTYEGIPFPANYVTTITNGDPAAVMSGGGLVPPGLAVNPVTGALLGSATTAGTYAVQLVYTDANQTLATAFTTVVEKAAAAGQGYRYLRIAVTDKADHLSNLVIRSASGNDIMHLVSRGSNNLSDPVYDQLVGKHRTLDFSNGRYQDFVLPTSVAEGSIEAIGHGSATVVYSGSVDGQTWIELGTHVRSAKPTQAFKFAGAQPDLFAFNGSSITDAREKIAYSFDLKGLVDVSSLDGISASDIAWSWELDPNRNVLTTMSTLPEGITLSGSMLKGTPTKQGRYALVLTGSYGSRRVSKAMMLEVTPFDATLTLQGAALATGERWVTPYSVDLKKSLTYTGMAVTDLTWAVSSATLESGEIAGLPAGMSLSADGVVSGIPSALGKYRFGVTVAWGKLASTSAVYTVEVIGGTVVHKYVSLSAGEAHTCGVTDTGSVSCWGQGSGGKLGNGATVNESKPVDVAGIDVAVSKASAVYAANRHSCALTANGGIKCWGQNSWGQTLTTSGASATDAVGMTSGVSDMASKNAHSCAVKAGGVQCYGQNFDMQTGQPNSAELYTYSPMPVTGVTTGIRSVAVGNSHSCALTTAGAVKCWGLRDNGRLGNGTTATTGTRTPAQVTGLTSGVTAIRAGAEFTCAITGARGVKCWGKGDVGQLGNGAVTDQKSPVDVTGLTSGVKEVATGNNHACALTDAGAVKCWGHGGSGKLGDGKAASSSVPVAITALSSGVIGITAGGSHSCALLADGSYKCWGLNTSGQLGDGTVVNKLAP